MTNPNRKRRWFFENYWCGRPGLQWCGLMWMVLAVSTDSYLASPEQEDPRWTVAPNINALTDDNVTPNSPALGKALTDAAEYVLRWQLPKDARSWQERRPLVERALRKAIGLEKLPERNPLNARILNHHDLGTYTMDNLVFYSRPDFPVTANLYRPKTLAPGKHPAVVCPNGHYLSVGKAAAENQILCIKLASLGFVVLTYDAIGQGERAISGNIHHEAGFSLLPLGQTIAGWMVWDTMRAIDYLDSLPEVDSKRIGVTGNSGGGLNTLFTAALDSRVQSAAIAGYVFLFNNWMKYAGAHCTCCYLPGLYREMEWFDVAGLIAPRAMLMLQGERDDIFPISGARVAGRNTEALFTMVGHKEKARFDEIKKEGHAYSILFRERMYGWMLHHLTGNDTASPSVEGDVVALPEDDPRLICDKNGQLMAGAPSVVDLAQKQARQAISQLSLQPASARRERLQRWVDGLTVPPDPEMHPNKPQTFEKREISQGTLEKTYFLSEDGQYIPGLLWLSGSGSAPRRTIIIVDDRGKANVAVSGMVEPLVEKGFAVLAVDLRGRGETLGRISSTRDNNFHFAVHSIMWGRPLAGRRAFDLKRTIDFVQTRKDLSLENLTVVGLGEEALPAILAAAGDTRIRRIACGGYRSSFLSQMVSTRFETRAELIRRWNGNAEDTGRLNYGKYEQDLGSVIPGVLETGDLPELITLLSPRKLLYCGVHDVEEDARPLQDRFRKVLQEANPQSGEWCRYEPGTLLDADLLLKWLGP